MTNVYSTQDEPVRRDSTMVEDDRRLKSTNNKEKQITPEKHTQPEKSEDEGERANGVGTLQ